MIKQTYIALAAILSVAAAGCGQRQEAPSAFDNMPVIASRVAVGNDSMIVTDLTSLPDPVTVRATDLLDGLEIVKLDPADEALTNTGYVWVTDKRIIIYSWDTGTKQYDRATGKYLGNIGARGQGPGEYTSVFDIIPDEDAGRIYILPYSADKILAYGLDGKYAGSIPLNHEIPKGTVKFDHANGLITVMALNFEGVTEPTPVWVQDTLGNIISEVRKPELSVIPDFSNELVTGVSGDNLPTYYPFRWMAEADTLYAFTGDRLRPDFTVRFNGDIPMHQYKSFPRFITVDRQDDIIARQNGMQATWQPPVVIDRTTLRGAPIKIMLDPWGTIILPNEWTFQKNTGYLTQAIDPGDLADMIDNADKEHPLATADGLKAMTQLRESIDPDDNCYVIIGRWK